MEFNEPPLFSILLASYNNGRYLQEAIDSIIAQTYTNWEVIVVDDFSTDNSNEVYKKYAADERFKFFYNKENKGCGYTKMRCAEEAKGNICGFLDPDDALTSDALGAMVEAHFENDDVSMVHATFYRCDENLKNPEQYTNVRNIESNNPYFFNLSHYIRHFTTFKRSFYLKTEGIDPYLIRAVDQDLYLKLYDVGRTLFLNKALYYYRIHDGGISTFNNIEKSTYWHWVVNKNTASRRGVNIEDIFIQHFASRQLLDEIIMEKEWIENKYQRLKKYEKLNNFLSQINSRFFRKKKI